MIQLIVTDLDGTLLPSSKLVPESLIDLELRLRNQGIAFVVASGRPYASMRKLLFPLLEHVLFIAENGGIIRYRDKELRCSPMKPNEVSDLIDASRKLEETHILLCGKDVMWHESTDNRFLEESSKYYDHMIHVSDLKQVNEDVLKFTLCDMISAETNSYGKLRHLEDQFSMAVSGIRWLDITDKQVNKGNALKHVQSLLGIPRENTVAFGDYFNDIELLKASGLSFAMKNAHPRVAEIADRITQFTNEEGGVILQIEALLDEMISSN